MVRDVTDAVNVPTPYAMTVTLGASGARLDANSDHFILFWNDTPLSRVAIIPPEAPVKLCKTTVVQVPVQDIGPYAPPKAGNGDPEFNGNGPRVRINALANATADRISVRLTMNARETKKDWTEVNGSTEYPIYKAPAGSAIDRLASAAESHLSVVEDGNTDRNTPHQVNLGLGGLLQYVRIVGDTGGDDVGRTQVSARLNPLSVVIHETEGCVPGTALTHLLGTRYLSTSLQRELSQRVRVDDSRLRTEMLRFRHP